MFGATRSTVVKAGGVIAEAIAASALTDPVSSVVTGEATEVVPVVSDIVEEISNGEVEKTMEEIIIRGKNIFRSLNDGQERVLKKVILAVRQSGYLHLSKLVNISINLLSQLEEHDVNFQNFQYLIKFVLAHVHGIITQRNDAYNQASSHSPGIPKSFDARRRKLAEIIITRIDNSIDTLFNIFKGFANEIKNLMEMIKPQFVNIFAAVYHYFKHKLIPETNIMLDAVQYFDLAEEMLNRLEPFPRDKQVVRSCRQRIVYERYYRLFGRRLMIVLKVQAGAWILSSCYFIDEVYENDEDGDEWTYGVKLPRR